MYLCYGYCNIHLLVKIWTNRTAKHHSAKLKLIVPCVS